MKIPVLGLILLICLLPEAAHCKIVDFNHDNPLFHPFYQKIRNFRSKDYLIKLLKRNLEEKMRQNRKPFDDEQSYYPNELPFKSDNSDKMSSDSGEEVSLKKCRCNCNCRKVCKRCGKGSNNQKDNKEDKPKCPHKNANCDDDQKDNKEDQPKCSHKNANCDNDQKDNKEDKSKSSHKNADCDDDQKPYVCEGQGTFPNPDDCHEFFICFHNEDEPIAVVCPKGFAFDTEKEKCSQSADRKCRQRMMRKTFKKRRSNNKNTPYDYGSL